MRLIGEFDTEKEAYTFYSFLLKEGVSNLYELKTPVKAGEKKYLIWVCDEENLTKALQWLEEYRKDPQAPQFQTTLPKTPVPPATPAYAEVSKKEDLKWKSIPSPHKRARRFSLTLTHFILLLCGVLFLWNDVQEGDLAKEKGPLVATFAMTPLQQTLLFDDPASYQYIQTLIDTVPLSGYKELKDLPPEAASLLKKAEEAPSWRGIYPFFVILKDKGWAMAKAIPLFEKIRQGEVWRLFTPCIMHRDFLHILFNMIWAWILIKQIEARLPKWKICLLMLLIGVVSNVFQYLSSGPFFLGFSGVVVGLAGFIWVRQRKAPWEGYPLQKGTALFLLFFVLAMFVIELLTFILHLLSLIQITPSIANTAHIVGGLVGMGLGCLNFFSRKIL